uniref:Uncharacterized protein n=1 Tax=Aegilops tauschii subsp. strangulata TaxID=200361 RepID=A0A453AMS1_AEGTS
MRRVMLQIQKMVSTIRPLKLWDRCTLTPDSVASENIASADRLKGKRRIIGVITIENDEIPPIPLVNVVPSSVAARTMDSQKPYPEVKNVVKDLSSCMKEVEILFFRACDSGKQVPMILEEDKIQFRPLLPEEIGYICQVTYICVA